MSRILIDLPDDDIAWLDATAKATGKSRAAVLREAVSAHILAHSKDWLEAGFGLWAKYGFTEDGMDYQDRMRREWVREWDAGYDTDGHGPDGQDPDQHHPGRPGPDGTRDAAE